MGKALDRKMQRRAYLRRKAGAYLKGTVGSALLVPTVLTFFLFAAITVVLIISCWGQFTPRLFAFGVLTAAITALTGALIPWCSRARLEFHRAAEMPVVPPVTAATLPADEVLVRGAVEPATAQIGVLLRAASVQETPKEQLLRVSRGADEL